MTNEHPITPSLELVQQWLGEFFGCTINGELSDSEKFLATQAARWGADQELEACCEWLYKYQYDKAVVLLLAARRPKPPSLKRLALDQLKALELHGALDCNTIHIRRALETLPND